MTKFNPRFMLWTLHYLLVWCWGFILNINKRYWYFYSPTTKSKNSFSDWVCEDKNTSVEHLGDKGNLAAYDHIIHVAATAYTEKQLYVISYFQFSHCWFLPSHPMLPHHCLLQRHSPVAKRIHNISKRREIAQASKSKCVSGNSGVKGSFVCYKP